MREVSSRDWGAFWDRVNQNELGATVTVQKLEPNGIKTEIAREVAFDGIAFGKRDDCNDHISLRVSGGQTMEHEVVEPIHIKLMESEGGAAFPSVIIEAEDGVTQIDFRPVIKAAWLNGIDLK
jgi:hypothetical protein